MKRRKSWLTSEETFHQNATVPGPVTVVRMKRYWLSEAGPLCAASTPSWRTTVWPVQEETLPPVDQTRLVASRASVRETRVATTMESDALELVTLEPALETTTEYGPAWAAWT